MTSTKKMSIFVLQPHALHTSWQVEKLNSVFQVSESMSQINASNDDGACSQLLESSHFKPNMIDEETMLNMKDLRAKMFVIEPFSGTLFQYLKSHRAW